MKAGSAGTRDSASAGVQRCHDAPEYLLQQEGILGRYVDAGRHLTRNLARLVPEGHALGGGRDDRDALVVGTAGAHDQVLLFEFLQEGCEGPRIKAEHLPDPADRDPLMFLPDDHHGDVLGVCEPYPVEIGLVFGNDPLRTGVQVEAQLVLEPEAIIFHLNTGQRASATTLETFFISAVGSKRARISPSLPMRNLVKFHFTFPLFL